MPEKAPSTYYSFEEYVDDVIDDAIIKGVAAEDYRVRQAVVFLMFQAPNDDRTVEANLLAAVAEDFGFEPEDMVRVVDEATKIAKQYIKT